MELDNKENIVSSEVMLPTVIDVPLVNGRQGQDHQQLEEPEIVEEEKVANRESASRQIWSSKGNDPSKEKQHMGQVCDVSVMTKKEYKEHNDILLEFPQCVLCGLIFKEKGDLCTHFQDRHCGTAEGTLVKTIGGQTTSGPIIKREEPMGNNSEQVDSVKGQSKLFNCQFCTAVFQTKDEYVVHARIVHEAIVMYVHKCEYCRKTFNDGSSLLVHVHKEHFKPYCQICGMTLQGENQLYQHLLHVHRVSFRVDKKRIPVCEFCGKKCCSEYDLKEHVMGSHLRKNQNHKCSLCERHFHSKQDLTVHIVQDHNRPTGEYETGVRRTNHTDHVSYKTPEVSKFVSHHACKMCNATFHSKAEVKEHLLLFHLRKKPSKECVECHKWFVTSDCLAIHQTEAHNNAHKMNTHYGRDKTLLANNTNGTDASVLNQIKQQNRETVTHIHPMPLKCEVCGTLFTESETLRLHQKMHQMKQRENIQQDLKQKCVICGKLFISKEILALHMTYEHVQIRQKAPDKDVECRKHIEISNAPLDNTDDKISWQSQTRNSKSSTNLEAVHRKTSPATYTEALEDGEEDGIEPKLFRPKMFQCHLCGFDSNSLSKVRRHMNSIHSEKPI